MYKEGFPYYQRCIAISNRHLCEGDYLAQVEKVCSLHPKAFVLREKDQTEAEYEALATQVIEITKRYGVKCVLHSCIGVAKALQHRHIHVPFSKLLEMKYSQKQWFETLGVSVHSVEEAKAAQEAHASYVTAGHIYATSCKPDLPPRGLEFLQQICTSVCIPVYAIGGIHLDATQWEEVLAQKAAGACIMSEFMQMH